MDYNRSPTVPAIICTKCGANVEDTSLRCWRCGRSRLVVPKVSWKELVVSWKERRVERKKYRAEQLEKWRAEQLKEYRRAPSGWSDGISDGMLLRIFIYLFCLVLAAGIIFALVRFVKWAWNYDFS